MEGDSNSISLKNLSLNTSDKRIAVIIGDIGGTNSRLSVVRMSKVYYNR